VAVLTAVTAAAALLSDAVTILYARAQHLSDHGRREWQPSETMPALVIIIIDEYAELAEQVPAALRDADTHRPAWPRPRRDPRGRHPAANPEGHGPGRGALPDEHAHRVPRARATRR
jgi:hypothetical protein